MSVLPIYTYGAPVLKKKAQPVKHVTDDTIKLIMDMFETMHKASGIGLAATQVGGLQRIIVVDISGTEGAEDAKPLALINPIVTAEEGRVAIEEGCLSIPELRAEVERAETITVRFKDANFLDVELKTGGLLARVILHEIDHLDGVLFTDRIPASEKKKLAEELKKIQHGEMEVNYPVVTALDVAA